MILANHMTIAQERRFYREAVQASLQEFYGKSESESRKLVRNWWKRLSTTRAFISGIFMHSEPINTAAGIADVQVIALTSKNRQTYHRILDRSRDTVLFQAKTSPAYKDLKPTNLIATEISESSGPKLSKAQIVREMSKKMKTTLKESEQFYNSLAQSAVQQHQLRSAEFYIAGIGQVVRAQRRTDRQHVSEVVKRAKVKSLTSKAQKSVAKHVQVAIG
jgi:hypothetical protein